MSSLFRQIDKNPLSAINSLLLLSIYKEIMKTEN